MEHLKDPATLAIISAVGGIAIRWAIVIGVNVFAARAEADGRSDWKDKLAPRLLRLIDNPRFQLLSQQKTGLDP